MACPPSDDSNSNSSSSGNSADLMEKTAVIRGDAETLKKELAKAKEQAACLIIIRGQPQGHRYFLTQPEMTIGRDPTTEIAPADQSISRRHAKIHQVDNQVTITDLGSSNGTFVNDKKIEPGIPVTLEKEDMIKMGNFIFKYLPAG